MKKPNFKKAQNGSVSDQFIFLSKKSGTALPLLFVLLLSLWGCNPVGDPDELPDTYVIAGDTVFPEGIAYSTYDNAFFVGSTTSGTIYKGNVGSGEVNIFAENNGIPTAIGLETDGLKLWIAGGDTGSAYLMSLIDGEVLAQFDSPEATQGTFINDVTVVPTGEAFFTDSVRPFLFKAAYTNADEGALEPWLDFTGTPIEYTEGFNLNGIASTPEGDYLFVVQSNTGQVFRIEVATKEILEVDLDGSTVTNGDGLLLSGNTLYVARNQNNSIVPIQLGDDMLSGELQEPITDPALRFPTTLARSGRSLFVVNGQLNTPEMPELPFTVSRLTLEGR